MTNREKVEKQLKIVERANKLNIIDMSMKTPKFTLLIDVSEAIPETCLDKLLSFSDVDFTHDITGIQSNWNRQLHIMENCFIPRCCCN